MSILANNDLFVLGCIAVITAAPFYYRYWLKRYPMRTLADIDQTASQLSIIIFVALFAGAFVFSGGSRKTGEVLLGAAILSFSILYQSRFRYLMKQNSPNLNADAPSTAAPAAPAAISTFRQNKITAKRPDVDGLLRKLALFTIGLSAALLISKLPPVLLALVFYSTVSPYLIRIKYPTTVMSESSLKEEFKNIFKAAGRKVREIYIIDSETYTKNAMMAGSTLFITIDLFQKLSDLELKAVICHEASHLQQNHALKRLVSSVGAFTLICFWLFLPTTITFVGSLTAIYLAMPILFIANNFFLSKIIRRQEMEADLGALDLGASSDALISALYKLSPPQAKKVPFSTRLIFGNFHPTSEERALVIRNGGLPANAYFQHKKYAYAYSLMILGYTFHVANQMAVHEGRMQANSHRPASISRLVAKDLSRIGH